MSYKIIQHIGEGPVQPALDFGKPWFPPNKFDPDGGAYRVLEHIRRNMCITTRDIHDPNGINADTARLRVDVKPYLRGHNIIQDGRPVKLEDGNYLYRFVRAEG
jgi:hypothetical protein